MTDFISNLKFESFKTYSFQRKGDFEIYENLKIKNVVNKLTNVDKKFLEKFRNSNQLNQNNNFIFTEKNKLNDSAELIYATDEYSNLNVLLIDILKTPFIKQDLWMCAPIYRDAILFYDANKNLIDGLNICFQCSSIIKINKEEISTDNTTFQKLKEFLKSLEHLID